MDPLIPPHYFERYPALLLLLHAMQEPLDSFSLPIDRVPWSCRKNLHAVDVLYIYGIGHNDVYHTLKDWLHEKKERRLILLEDDVRAVVHFLHMPYAEAVLFDPQVVLHCIADPKQWEMELYALSRIYPADQVELEAIPSYAKRRKKQVAQMRLHMLRFSAIAHTLTTEIVQSHRLLPNLLANIMQWPASFIATDLKNKFQNVPAVVCGAGPSLQCDPLKRLMDRALIIAGGSAITALSHQGIIPHLGIAVDPNLEELERLKGASMYEMPLIYASRLQADVLQITNAERGYLHSATGGSCERYFEKMLHIEQEAIGPEMGSEALSVTTLSIALAVEMGCNPILLNGIDLAYTNQRRYAEGVLPDAYEKKEPFVHAHGALERVLKRKSIRGRSIDTLLKWVMESECIAAYAKKHRQVCFYNVSTDGLGFRNIPNCTFEEVIDKACTVMWDLKGRLHAETQRLKCSLTSVRVTEEMTAIQVSLLRLKGIVDEMLEELTKQSQCNLSKMPTLPTGKMVLLESDFQEEKAFSCLFSQLDPLLDEMLARLIDRYDSHLEDKAHMRFIEKQAMRWKHYQEVIQQAIVAFRKYGVYCVGCEC